MVLPFVDTDQQLHNFFPDRYYAVAIPAYAGAVRVTDEWSTSLACPPGATSIAAHTGLSSPRADGCPASRIVSRQNAQRVKEEEGAILSASASICAFSFEHFGTQTSDLALVFCRIECGDV